MRVRNYEITPDPDGLLFAALIAGFVIVSYGIGRLVYFLDQDSSMATFEPMPGFIAAAFMGVLMLAMVACIIALVVLVVGGFAALVLNVEEMGDE